MSCEGWNNKNPSDFSRIFPPFMVSQSDLIFSKGTEVLVWYRAHRCKSTMHVLQVAAGLSSGDCLVFTELLFNGSLSSLTATQLASIVSCFVWLESFDRGCPSPEIVCSQPLLVCFFSLLLKQVA